MFKSNKIPSPYQCDPLNNAEMCQLFFNVTDYIPGQDADQNYVNTTCKCALDGENGFCGQVLGAYEYEDSLTALKPVLEKSNCHTLDRFDFRAHKDVCGVGYGNTWKDAVQQRFKVNHWPYINAKEPVSTCLEGALSDSLSNLSKDLSNVLSTLSVFVTFVLVLVVSA